ncbi:MutS-related protein [Nocardia jejuensis]|uniref:MutS-related protein n=1 Tax=Nocardia jejuensis TaxID=328049 RepID=UPI001472632D|nr:DNA mismatch repair protein MutS [Nocardia jejuensis]
MRIDEHRIILEHATDAPDYTAMIERLFTPITSGLGPPAPRRLPTVANVHPVEERVLDQLARLFPGPFHKLTEYTRALGDFIDPAIGRVGDELGFFFAYLRLVDTLGGRGMDFCLPVVTDSFDGIRVQGAFDMALATKNVDSGTMPVVNDYQLVDGERIIVVTGPNQGGKSTFARMFGQVAYLASLGCPVPARRARIMLPDTISTHFERREHASDAAGKLQSELIAIHETLDFATDRTLIILNESFSSTATSDAQRIGEQILRKISDTTSIALFVTFLDELTRMDGIVSMVAGVGADPTLRTFKVERKPADGRAYAAALANQFDLTYEAIVERVTR